MFDMRALVDEAATLPNLSEQEQRVLRGVATGVSPREVADQLGVAEEYVYRVVAYVLEELQPGPAGETIHDVHARHGSRPATPDEVDEFERRFGPSQPPDAEG